ncbi:MAG: hypothetical protein QM813_14330 [Verrucomicrobiota bacterium]
MNRESTNSPGFEAWKLVLKLFLPSWNFFNDFDAATRLEFCTVRAGEAETVWQPVHPNTSTANLLRVFFNAQGNRELLEKSLVDRIATAVQESPQPVNHDFAQTEAGLILARIVRLRLQEQGTQAMSFRFRLVAVAAENHSETLFESVALPLGETPR